MKTQSFNFPLRSLFPTFMCGLLFLPVVDIAEHAAAAEQKPTAVAQQSIQMVSVNTADAETIADALQGVGLKKAQAIVAWREANGNFTTLEQLLEVKGIGEKTLVLK